MQNQRRTPLKLQHRLQFASVETQGIWDLVEYFTLVPCTGKKFIMSFEVFTSAEHFLEKHDLMPLS